MIFAIFVSCYLFSPISLIFIYLKQSKMETKLKKTIFEKAPSWLLAVLIFILSYIAVFITDSIWTPHTETGLKSYLISDVIIAFGCFFIVKSNPKSIWYVLLICNTILIIPSFVEPHFWNNWKVMICASLGFSIVVSIIAAQLAKSKQTN
jgi:hypothetical protein